MEQPVKGPDRTLRLAGRVLVGLGVAVWGVYLAVRLSGHHAEGWWFLPFHLAGVIPGAILARWHRIRELLGRR